MSSKYTSYAPPRRPCREAPRIAAPLRTRRPPLKQKRCPLHIGCARASHIRTRLPTSRSFAPPFLHLLGKHGKAGINSSASDSTWQSVSAIDPNPKPTTDRCQKGGLTPIRVRLRSHRGSGTELVQLQWVRAGDRCMPTGLGRSGQSAVMGL